MKFDEVQGTEAMKSIVESFIGGDGVVQKTITVKHKIRTNEKEQYKKRSTFHQAKQTTSSIWLKSVTKKN